MVRAGSVSASSSDLKSKIISSLYELFILIFCEIEIDRGSLVICGMGR